MTAEITGIGWVTANGMGCGKDHNDFAMINALLPEITPKSIFEKPDPTFRRMDEYSRLGLAAIAFALKDADLDEWTRRRNIGIIAATEFGCLHTDIDYFDTVVPRQELGPSPALFSYTLPNSFLGDAAIRFGLTGPSFVVNEQVPTGLTSLQMALDSIGCDEIATMLCGVCDLGCPSSLDANGILFPGALFFVFEKPPAKGSFSYGTIGLDAKSRILFHQTPIENLTELVHKCLTSYRGSSIES